MEFEIVGTILMLSEDEKSIMLRKDSKTGSYFLPGVKVETGQSLEEKIKGFFDQKCDMSILRSNFIGVIENIFTQKGKIRHQYLFIFKVKDHCNPPQIPKDESEFEWHNLPLPISFSFEPEILKNDLIRWLKGGEIIFQSQRNGHK